MRPRIEISELTSRLQEKHLLMLPVHFDRRRECGKLADGGHCSVNRTTATPGDTQTPTNDMLVFIDDACFGKRLLGAITHHRIVGTHTTYELEGREKRRLTRTRLAREDGQTRCEGYGRVLDEGDIGYMELVEHAPLPIVARACPDADHRRRRARHCGRRRRHRVPRASHALRGAPLSRRAGRHRS